jgi:hypothetical protein
VLPQSDAARTCKRYYRSIGANLKRVSILLSIALMASVIVLAVEVVAVWETVLGAKWIFGRW